MAIALNYAARSDVGLGRTTNQDSGYAGPHLLVIADGMGGHAGGDVASSLAVGEMSSLDGESHGSDDAAQHLHDAIEAANEQLRRRIEAEPTSTAWARRSRRSCAPAPGSCSPTSATRAATSCATAR